MFNVTTRPTAANTTAARTMKRRTFPRRAILAALQLDGRSSLEQAEREISSLYEQLHIRQLVTLEVPLGRAAMGFLMRGAPLDAYTVALLREWWTFTTLRLREHLVRTVIAPGMASSLLGKVA